MMNTIRFKKIASILKQSFINEAKIIMEVKPKEIRADLVGKFSFGNQILGGASYLLKDNLTLNSDPGKSIWIQHKGIDSSAYRGLGYARDLMVAGITEVSNNNGVVISIDSVTNDAQDHNIKSSNAGFNIQVVALWNNIIWDKPEDLILEFPNGDVHRDGIIKLFLEPYIKRDFIHNNRGRTIETGLLISISTAKCSLPILYENYDWDENNWEESFDKKQREINLPGFYRNDPFYKNDLFVQRKVKDMESELTNREDYVRSIRNISKTQQEIRSDIDDQITLLINEKRSIENSLMKNPNDESAKKTLADLLLKKKELEEKFYNM